MNIDVGDIARFSDAIERFDRVLNRMGDAKNIGTANVNINAGGVAVWISATCCIAMMVGLVLGSVFLASKSSSLDREFNRIDQANHKQDKDLSDLHDYLSAIYMQAPQLRPKEEKK